jgi:hypothetical protein
MANSKLLKEAIADAKAVKETALANAKLALEEAFTPRLQSILAQKLQAEAEKESEEEMQNEELKSSEVGSADTTGHNPGKVPALKADTEVEAGEVKKTSTTPAQINHDYTKTKDISETYEEEGDDSVANEIAALQARLAELQGMGAEADHFGQEEDSMDSITPEEGDLDNDGDHDMADHDMEDDSMDMDSDDDQMGGDDQDDMDLEAIIRELEQQLEGSDEEEGIYESEDEDEDDAKNESYTDGSDAGTDKGEDPKVVMNNEQEDVTKATVKGKVGSFDNKAISEDVIDLEEILREMEADMKDGEEEKKDDAKDAELNEAYNTIKSLQKTINEVNLLNAKLLFANKLFRAHNMTNEQKVKVIETLDRTNSVREVKLVYSTLAENFKYTSTTNKSTKKSISEGIASKVVKSTAPKAEVKQVIAESADFADRFKKLAGIIK